MSGVEWLSPSTQGKEIPLERVPTWVAALLFVAGSQKFVWKVLKMTTMAGKVVVLLEGTVPQSLALPGLDRLLPIPHAKVGGITINHLHV